MSEIRDRMMANLNSLKAKRASKTSKRPEKRLSPEEFKRLDAKKNGLTVEQYDKIMNRMEQQTITCAEIMIENISGKHVKLDEIEARIVKIEAI